MKTFSYRELFNFWGKIHFAELIAEWGTNWIHLLCRHSKPRFSTYASHICRKCPRPVLSDKMPYYNWYPSWSYSTEICQAGEKKKTTTAVVLEDSLWKIKTLHCLGIRIPQGYLRTIWNQLLPLQLKTWHLASKKLMSTRLKNTVEKKTGTASAILQSNRWKKISLRRTLRRTPEGVTAALPPCYYQGPNLPLGMLDDSASS